MCSLFFSEARRIACESLWQLFFRYNSVNEFTNHGMLTGSDQIEVFPLNLIHHGIHLSKTHNSCHHIAANHKRRNTVSKSSVYHKVSCIGNNSRVKPCNIPHKIVKSVSCYFPGTVQIKTVETLHDFRVVRNFKIRNYRLTVFLNLYIFRIIFANRHRWVNNIRNGHHYGFDFFFYFSLLSRQTLYGFSIGCNFLFYLLCLFFPAFLHKTANHFGDFISFCSQSFHFFFNVTIPFIQLNDFVYKQQFAVLEFIFNILFYNIRVFS